MKKLILAVAVATMIAGVVFVACQKETTTTDKKEVIKQGVKQQKEITEIDYTGYFDNTIQVLNKIYSLCNIVYHEDSLSILSVCLENNLEGFYNLLGISEIDVNYYSDIIAQDIHDFMDAYPEYTSTNTGCSECSATALVSIGNALSATNGHLYIEEPCEDCKACLAICLLGCIEAGPAYALCVAGCYALCRVMI